MKYMSRVVGGAVALAVLAGPAFAADLPSRRAPAPVVALPPAFTWTGFYAGVNVGGGVQTTDFRNVGLTGGGIAALSSGARPMTQSQDATGVVAGGQIGYNYQLGNIVLGVEADADYTDLKHNQATVGTTGLYASTRQNLNYLGTVRGRVGYAFDRIMVYGTGGFAYGDLYTRTTFMNAAGPAFSGQGNETRNGWTAGAGVEYAMPTTSFLNFFNSSAVTLKAEYLHYDLGKESNAVASLTSGAALASSSAETTGDLGRIGLNYKFGTY